MKFLVLAALLGLAHIDEVNAVSRFQPYRPSTYVQENESSDSDSSDAENV